MHHKILLIGELQKPYNNGWFYKAGLEKNGHRVIPFDPESAANPLSKVDELINEHGPDFILHAKDELPAEAFEKLKKKTRVIMWYPDPVTPPWLSAYVRASDVFLTMSEGLIGEFKKYNPNVFWLSQAFEPSCFGTKEMSEEDRKTFSAEVTFVGNLGSKEQYLRRRGALEKVLKAGVQFKWWGPRLPRKFSTLLIILGKLGKAYGGKFVWGEEYVKVAQLSKIFLAFDSQPHIRKSMSARMYTAVGCGAFYMCQHVDGIEEMLEPGKEIVTFHNEQEMINLIKYYLEHENVRKQIAEAGRARVLKDHTYEVRMKEMVEMIHQFI